MNTTSQTHSQAIMTYTYVTLSNTQGKKRNRRITATRDDLSGAVTKAVAEMTLDR